MKTLLGLAVVALALTACEAPGPVKRPLPSADCEKLSPENTWIKYGDSNLSAKPVTKIGKKSLWRFKLQPDNNGPIDYDSAIVTITSKTPEYAWLSVSGKRADSSDLIVCVPDGLEIGTVIEYMISVQWVGTLDPRGEVVPN